MLQWCKNDFKSKNSTNGDFFLFPLTQFGLYLKCVCCDLGLILRRKLQQACNTIKNDNLTYYLHKPTSKWLKCVQSRVGSDVKCFKLKKLKHFQTCPYWTKVRIINAPLTGRGGRVV